MSFDLIAEQVLTLAKSKGADQAAVLIKNANSCDVSVRTGKLDRLEQSEDIMLHLTVYKDHHSGQVTASNVSVESVPELVEKAISIAQYTEKDEANGIADPALCLGPCPDLKLHTRWDITPREMSRDALLYEQSGLAVSDAVSSESVDIYTIESTSFFANSAGVSHHHSSTMHQINASFIAQHETEKAVSHDFSIARDPSQLTPGQQVSIQAARAAYGKLGARQVDTMQCPVVFDASIARALFYPFVQAIGGKLQYEGTSFLLSCLSQDVFPSFLSVTQQPHIQGGVYSSPFDSEGVIRPSIDIVSSGIVKNYILGSYAARRLNMQSTGNAGGISNLLVSHSGVDQQTLLRQMNKGLLVTELMGGGVDLLTGSFSKGAAGFWVEHGDIQYPVKEVTIAGNLKDLFKNIIAIASDIDARSSIQSGSVLISEMMVSGR